MLLSYYNAMFKFFYMKKQVLGTGFWVLGVNSNGFFNIRCGRWSLPCGVILKGRFQVYLSRAPPPMDNRNRTIELSTVPVRTHCPSGEGRHNAIYHFQYSLCPTGHAGYMKR